jgi:tRNA G10  N-methylase Trm11
MSINMPKTITMKYFFTLGNNPTLSIAELSAVFGLEKDLKEILVRKNVLVLETEEEIDCGELIKKIGGTIKIGEIIDSTLISDDDLDFKLTELVIEKHDEENKKLKFGVSCYGEKGLDVKKLAMNIKNNLKGSKISSSWVVGKRRDEPVSSVAVEGNKLITKGIELILIKNGEEILIGKTLAVQPFKDLSFRDYNRPARDDRSGMIPPKLAQMMLNLAMSVQTGSNLENPLSPLLKKGEEAGSKVIYDPFCGSGTILTEAILMRYKTIIGSDISQKAVKDTQQNIEWITEKYKLGKINANVFLSDASQSNSYLRKKIVDAIVTEPYLGPQRGRFDVEKVVRELNRLYANSLKEFKKILRTDGRIVMIWPIFRIKKKLFKINPSLDNFKIINPIPHSLLQNESVKLTDRKTIIYGRKGQRVWREIVVLSSKR